MTKSRVGTIRNRLCRRRQRSDSPESVAHNGINHDTSQIPEILPMNEENQLPPIGSTDPPGNISQSTGRLTLPGGLSSLRIDPPARYNLSQDTLNESDSLIPSTERSVNFGQEERSDPNGIFPEADETMDAAEPCKPGAYHVSKCQTGEPVLYQISIPEGVSPGYQFPVWAGSRFLSVLCPETDTPGQLLTIEVPPEPSVIFKLLKTASLTCSYNVSEPCGGARARESDISRVNDRALRGDGNASTHVVTIPNDVSPGEYFSVSVDGRRFEVKCPPNMEPGKRIRVSLPRSRNDLNNSDNSLSDVPTTQVFHVKIPRGVQPGKLFAVSVTVAGQQKQRVLVRCPAYAMSGQYIEFHLPTSQVVENIQLKYETFHRAGWKRIIRADDLRFQWFRLNGEKIFSENISNEKLNKAEAMEKFDNLKPVFDISFVRKVTFLEGNDTRLRTGLVELVSADDAFVDSTLVRYNRTTFSFADIAVQQSKPLHEKHDWFCNTICKRLLTPRGEGDEHIRIYVHRSNLLKDSVRAVMALSEEDMKRQWKIHFLGEPVLDAGGPTKEWFELVTDQIFDPSFGLWLPSANNQTCLDINVDCETILPNKYLIYYRFTGRVIGRALFDGQLIPKAHMVRIIYKHILGWPITFDDIKDQDDAYFESLQQLTRMENVANLSLDFTITEERNGIKKFEDLVADGSSKEVNNENLPDFLRALLIYRTFTRTLPQLTELLLGFFDVVPEPALTIFDAYELELVLCGFPVIDLKDWRDNTEYKGVFEFVGMDHIVVKWFWEIVGEVFDVEMRARLLQFATGTSGVPASGFAGLQGNDGSPKKFTIHGVDSSQFIYPKSHTCFNTIDLPVYSSKEELAEKLTVAITTSFVGFDLE